LIRSTGGAHEATGQSDGACNVYCAPQDKRSGLISFGELCGYELQESPVEGCGVKPDQCSRSKRSSLALLAASRAFSFLSCSIAFSSCKILCSSAYLCTFLSIVGCQLSFCKSRRHRGKEARNSCLLR